ncbi:extracellular solute-binding protein [Candidatus Halobeggiatoa sp. HSG11]|nr:extracellular solute-binding protein [Candidatus Halobeggiatoa sp. HSG11]
MTNSKKITIFISIIIVIALISNIFWGLNNNQSPIYIAMIHSPNDSDGKAMYRVIQGYIDQVNENGGVNNKPLELLIFDDQNDKDKARQVANEIVEQNKAHAVIGHYTSSACLEGGEVYKKANIPTISATCTADDVTKNNDWYFRVVPNNKFQGIFLANYVKRVLNYDEITIIYDENSDYSKTLLNGFENLYLGLKGTIKNKWSIANDASTTTNEKIENITKQILQDHVESNIFLALNAEQAKEFIVSMRRKGLNYPMVGGDSIGKKTFAAQFNEYPEEQAQPGFFSDGIYAVSPMIYDVAGENAQLSRNAYINKYHEEPTWVAVTAHESIQVIVEAMQDANIKGEPNNLINERKQIRDYLATRSSMETGIKGLNGKFHFDLHGNAVKPLAIGVFKNQQLISALTQFQHVPNPANIPNLEEEVAAERIVVIDGQYMHKTDIVYTGIDFNEISNLDAKSSKYEVDFYLWFRFKKNVQADAIKFINSVRVGFSELKLGKAVAEKMLPNDVVYRAYQVKAQFKERFNFRDYPFDTQKLAIRFKHDNLTRYNIIYVVDFVGMNTRTILDKFHRNHVFDLITDWNVNAVSLFQDITKNESTLGDPNFFGTKSSIEYSRFNAVIEVKRDVLSFVTKNLLPLLFLIGLSYLIMFLPFKEISVGAVSGTLVAVAFFHLSLANGLPSGIGYAVVLDYGFYVIYGLIIFQLFLVVVGQREAIRESKHAQQKVLLLGRIVYPIVFVCAGILTFYIYGSLNISSQVDKNDDSNVAEVTTPTDDKVTLTLGAWQVEDVEQMAEILAIFNQQHPNITVKFQPFLEYVKMLRFQLKNNIAPDLFYVEAFSLSRPLSEAGYLESLGELPYLDKNFDLTARSSWTDYNDKQYAIPFMAVSHAIFYNEDLFDELALEIPTTWEELLIVANEIKQAGYLPFANGTQTDSQISELLFMDLAPNFIGGQEGRLEYEAGKRCFNDKHVVETFQAVKDIVPFFSEKSRYINEEMTIRSFLGGNVAMFIGSSDYIIPFESADFEWSIFAIPAPEGKPQYITYHPEIGVSINSASKHKKEAQIFLEWLTKPETTELFSNALPGFFPLHNQETNLKNKDARDFLALNKGRGKDARWSYPNLMDGLPDGKWLMYKNTEAVILGEKTPQEAADALQDNLAQWYEPAQKCLRLQ